MNIWDLNRILLTLLMIHYAFSTPNLNLIGKNNKADKVSFNENLKLAKRQDDQLVKSQNKIPNIPLSLLRPIPIQPIERFCCNFPESMCDETSTYRTVDGTCNNLENPCWGSAGIEYTRLLPPQYEDDFESPRGFGRSPPLPRSRDVSVAMTETIVPPNPDAITLMVMQWGQFIDHDMVLTANDAGSGSPYFGRSCCDDFMNPFSFNPSCLPIDVQGDTFYDQFGVTCLPFIRSTGSFCENEDMMQVDPGLPQPIQPLQPLGSLQSLHPLQLAVRQMGERQQINDVTAYLDASQVYGSSEEEMMNLRVPGSYELKSGPGDEGICPASAENVCPLTFLPVRNNVDSGEEEFFAGDGRVEEQPGLTSVHTIFVRFHNHIAQIIADNNPLSDEEIFQETRKIVGAMMQQITYNEFLPIVLGETIMSSYSLKLQPVCSKDPYCHDYDTNIDASAQNVFAAAAFRFGHSLIKDKYLLPEDIEVYLSKSFNNHQRTQITGTYPSHFLRGISNESSEEMDHMLADAVQNKLLAVKPFEFGSDLYARNIERAREHGLAGYIDWFHFCGGLASDFRDLYKVMPKEVVDRLETEYDGILEDVDLFPAAIAEYNLPGSLLGPTFSCINTKHFLRLKFGDRFWFENPGVFTVEQLTSLRKTKLCTLLCKYTDAKVIQEFVMLPVSSSNPLLSCSSLLEEGVINDIPFFWSS